MQKVLFFVILITFSLFSCRTSRSVKVVSQQCATRYPVVLVHGVSYRDDVQLFKYWRHIPDTLRKHGAKVFLAHQNAFNSHRSNALVIKKRIGEILAQTGSEKINIVAHSKGGLESRYLISELGMADSVATLTTLASPHRGSALADLIVGSLYKTGLQEAAARIIGLYARAIGDKDPQVLAAGVQLSRPYMEKFNQEVLDKQGVYYQSYGGIVSARHPNPFIKLNQLVLFLAEGKNDSQVALSSYQWGDFRGTVESGDDIGVSHFAIIGMGNAADFDAYAFYIFLLKDLKQKGF